MEQLQITNIADNLGGKEYEALKCYYSPNLQKLESYLISVLLEELVITLRRRDIKFHVQERIDVKMLGLTPM